MVKFSILALPSFSSTFCKELWTLCMGLCFFNLVFTFFFKHFLQGIIGLRCSMVTFVYLIFTFFLSNFCKELKTSGVGWLHDSILSPPSFLNTFCKELRTSSVGWLLFYLMSAFFFKHFLPGIIGLSRMVTFFYLCFTFLFEHFLQRTMDLRHRLITSPQSQRTPHKQFTNCLRIFNSFYLPRPAIRRVPGGFGVRGDVSLADLPPPIPLNVNLPGHGF